MNDGFDSSYLYSPLARELLDTAELQRMRDVNQLGFVPFVYPNATHSRFVHLLGTSRQAEKMWEAMRCNGPAQVGDYRSIVVSAAILHDIGHPPKSHGLEALIRHFTQHSHEEVGGDLISGDYSLRQFWQDLPTGLVPEGERQAMMEILKDIPLIPEVLGHFAVPPETVAQLIDPKRASRNNQPDQVGQNHFLREIISHSVIDADRLDYLQRDPLMTGIKEVGFDAERIIANLGIIVAEDGYHLALERGALESVNFALSTRRRMFEVAYHHLHVLEPEAMVYEACKRFLRSLENPAQYGNSIHLLNDQQFEAFFTAQSRDPIANILLTRAKWDRRNWHRLAYGISARDMPTTRDEPSVGLKVLQQLEAVDGDFPEDTIRDEILARANAGGKKAQLEGHDIIVYQRLQKGLKTREQFLNKFDLYVFRKPNTNHGQSAFSFMDKPQHYHAARALRDGSEQDEHLRTLFHTFCRQQTSLYLMVSTPPQHGQRVRQAAEEYIREIVR